MIKSGLVSVTFRAFNPRQIVELVAEAKLQGIEWGGDIHVPHGDIKQAQFVRQITVESGLEVAAYGSYYHVIDRQGKREDFGPVLDSAKALGAPLIRVWAGEVGSNKVSNKYRAQIVKELNRIGTLAKDADIMIGIEYHSNTLTDTNQSAQRLIQQIGHSNIKLYWQPPTGLPKVEAHKGLKAILDRLAAVHVFHWNVAQHTTTRQPLAEGETVWREYLNTIKAVDGDLFTMLEFVKDDSIQQFTEDARVLRKWLEML